MKKRYSYTNMFTVLPVLAMLLFCTEVFEKPAVEILGHWTYESSKEEVMTYSRHSQFNNRKGGIAFLKNGKLIKRQNAGWCGTPPISYRNFDGTWNWKNENTLVLDYKFWGGTINEVWEVIESSKNELKVKSISFETMHDKR